MTAFHFDPGSRPTLAESLTLFSAPDSTRSGAEESFTQHLHPAATTPPTTPARSAAEQRSSDPPPSPAPAPRQAGARSDNAPTNQSSNRAKPADANPAATESDSDAPADKTAETPTAAEAAPDDTQEELAASPTGPQAADQTPTAATATADAASTDQLAAALTPTSAEPEAKQQPAEGKSTRQRVAEIANPVRTKDKRPRTSAAGSESATASADEPGKAQTPSSRARNSSATKTATNSLRRETKETERQEVTDKTTPAPTPTDSPANPTATVPPPPPNRHEAPADAPAAEANPADQQVTTTSLGSTTPDATASLPAIVTPAVTPIAESPRGGERSRERTSTPSATDKTLEPVANTPNNAAPTTPVAIEDLSTTTPSVTADRTDNVRANPAGVGNANSNPSPAVSGPTIKFAQHLAAKSTDKPARGVVTEAEQARLVDRVAKAVQAADAKGGTVTLRLHPPELGVVRVELKVQDGILSARLEAETPAAQSALLDNSQVLRDRLAEQGVRVDRFDVDLMDRRMSDNSRNFDQQQTPPDTTGRRPRVPEPLRADHLPPETPRPASRTAVPGQLNVIV